jgi:replication-associated recombination protein RarA
MEVPSHLRNDGEGYVYPHDFPGHWAPQAYLPEVRRFYLTGQTLAPRSECRNVSKGSGNDSRKKKRRQQSKTVGF